MFNPSSTDVRNFFFDVYAKAQLKQPLTDLEKIADSIIRNHPEYNSVLENRSKYLEFQWIPEMGETNPFLHMSMHISIQEQLSIDQPDGIRSLYTELCLKTKDEHETQHQIIDCLGEMLWQSERNKTPPDANLYFACIKQKIYQ